ncbi:CopG family transcriptional regulator [Novosphingobium flavum]|uniref:CopG family transcriptional regulator n=1 Tax=Novosphingobium flavum TaxID=1778672 RepID=A0A7X1KMQ2_9SPHN|nr:ribbon-helix-helix protein, CopG family [Novosphingobium flavum]MBC2666598.1 CopG family transcriptional regulator [Novosphingobium flavum]
MRILADLPDDDIKWLDARAAELGKSRAALLRAAVSAYREKERDWLEQGFGLWTRYGQGADGADYEQSIRAQWLRKGEAPNDDAA